MSLILTLLRFLQWKKIIGVPREIQASIFIFSLASLFRKSSPTAAAQIFVQCTLATDITNFVLAMGFYHKLHDEVGDDKIQH
jgi:hypothetical protein